LSRGQARRILAAGAIGADLEASEETEPFKLRRPPRGADDRRADGDGENDDEAGASTRSQRDERLRAGFGAGASKNSPSAAQRGDARSL